MRTFLAVEPDSKIKEKLFEFAQKLPLKKARLVSKKQIHLTLFFWENLTQKEVKLVKSICQAKIPQFKKFELSISGLNAFPNKKFAKIVWVGAEAEILRNLWQKLLCEFKKTGLPTEKRDFIPHLTLLRLKRPVNIEKIEFRSKLKFWVEKLTLFSSELTPTGPIHKKIAEFSLQ